MHPALHGTYQYEVMLGAAASQSRQELELYGAVLDPHVRILTNTTLRTLVLRIFESLNDRALTHLAHVPRALAASC